MKKITTLLIILSCLAIVGCKPGRAKTQDEAIASKCNKKPNTLAQYAMCRCRMLTRSKTYTPELDACLTNKERYAKGWIGEMR